MYLAKLQYTTKKTGVSMDNLQQDRNSGKPPWALRRLIIMITLIFCATCVTYIVLYGDDTRVNETIIVSCFALAGATIGSYVFGAVWDDRNKQKHQR